MRSAGFTPQGSYHHFVTHRLETARLLGDNIVVMENGHITAQGTHSGVMRAENFYSEYWKSITL